MTGRASKDEESLNGPGALPLDRRLAYLVLRLSPGINMFIHGGGRIYKGVHNFVSVTEKLFVDTVLPMWLVHDFLTILPYIEAVIGALLILGLWTRWALTAEGLMLIVLVFGTGLRPDWTVVSIQMVYLLTLYVLLAMRQDDHYSLDTLLARPRRN